MRKFTYLFALLAVLLGAQWAKAETVSPYMLNFDIEIDVSSHNFSCASGWGHIVDFDDDSGWSTQYASYYWSSSYGRNNTPGLYCGTQTYYDLKDLLVTPAITGTSSIYAIQNYSTNCDIKFYKVTKEGDEYVCGDEITVDKAALNTNTWTKIDIPAQEGGYIGIWGSGVKIDDFEAESAEVVKQKRLKMSSVTALDGSTLYVDENGQFTIRAKANLKNVGDLDLNPGDEGYTLSIVNQSNDNVVVGTYDITRPLAVGDTINVYPEVKVNYADYPQQNRYDIIENISGTSAYITWYTLVPYEAAMQLRYNGSAIKDDAVYDWGKLNVASSKTFVVRNTGGKTLNVTSITVPEGFSTSATTPFTVAPGSDVEFDVTLLAETAGEYAGNVTVSGDEVDDFSFGVKGTVLDPQKWFVTFEDKKVPAGCRLENNWSVTQIQYSYNSDNCYAMMHSSSLTETKFITPLLTVAEGEKLSFDAGKKSSSSSNSELNVYYSTDRVNWTLAKAIANSELSSTSNGYGWSSSPSEATTFELDNVPAGNYYIGFGGKYVYVDNIYGYALADVAHDWMLVSSKKPEEGMVNYAYTASATLTNSNVKDELPGAITAKLHFGDDVVSVVNDTIVAGDNATFSLSYTPHAVGTFDAYIEFVASDGYQLLTDTVSVTVAEEVFTSELQIGDYAQTSSGPAPLKPYDKNSFSDAIYTADMLAKYGLKKGNVISKITYKGYRSSYSEGDLTVNLQGWIANEKDATYPDTYAYPDTTAMTSIYNGTYVFHEGGTEAARVPMLEITLPEPFVYDGNDIRIFMQHSAEGYKSIYFEVAQDNGHNYAASNDNADKVFSSAELKNFIAIPYFSLVVEPAKFTGTVKNAYGEPVAGAAVTLTSDQVIYSGTTDADGAYSITVLQAGLPYILTAEAEDYELYADADTILLDSISSKDIVLSLIPSTITLTEGEWATFSAKEPIDFSQTDINAYVVTAVSGDNATLKRVEKVPARTGVVLYGNGTYTLPAATDAEAVESNLLVATADSAYTVKDDDVNKVYTFANSYFSKAAAGDVVAKKTAYLSAEGASAEVYLELPKVTFSGTVSDGSKAIAGATVVLTDKSGAEVSTLTDSEGRFTQTVDQTNQKYVISAKALGYDSYESDSIVALTDTVLAITLTRQPIVATVSALGWTSFSSIFPVDLTETGLTAYIVTSYADGQAIVEAAGTNAIPARTGVLLKGEAGDYTLPVADEAAALANNILGNTAEAPLEITADNAATVYAYAEVSEAAGFAPCETGYSIPMGQAYLPLTAATSAEFYALYDPTTGIGLATADGIDESKPLYNLAGQQVTKSYRGVVVQNGKKFIRK